VPYSLSPDSEGAAPGEQRVSQPTHYRNLECEKAGAAPGKKRVSRPLL